MINTLKSSLGLLAGAPGDYYLGIAAVTTKKFSHIIIGPAGATITVCKIRGVDVLTARNYSTLPAGYIMVAGNDDYFDSITLSAGNASGIEVNEDVRPSIASVAVINGVHDLTMTPTLTFTNTSIGYSRDVRWRVKNAAGTVVNSGTARIYFLPGTSITVTIPGLQYYSAIATGYTFEINLADGDTWITSGSFNIT